MGVDPVRLLVRSGASDSVTRAVLQSVHEVTIPAAAKGSVWTALGIPTAPVAASLGATPRSAFHGALKAGLSSKVALLVPVLAGAIALAVAQRAEPTASAPRVVPAIAPAAAPGSVPAPPASTELRVEPPALPPPARPQAGAPVEGSLAKESAMLTRARAELRAGDAAAARLTLGRMHRALGNGALWQERELLAIEALAMQGHAKSADRLARAFLAAHSESPHAPAVRRFLLP